MSEAALRAAKQACRPPSIRRSLPPLQGGPTEIRLQGEHHHKVSGWEFDCELVRRASPARGTSMSRKLTQAVPVRAYCALGRQNRRSPARYGQYDLRLVPAAASWCSWCTWWLTYLVSF